MVTLGDVTRTGVLEAVAEFDRVGRDAFLKSAGFGRARAYYLEHDGRLYDSKAITGYAHGVSTGTRLGPGDFSGGDKTVAQRLEALGFTVLNVANPAWTRDEIILACELVEANGWRQVDANDPRVGALSELLQSPAIHPFPRNPDFRNPAGVAFKTYNIASTHPDYRGPQSNGNRLDKLDKEVLDDFLADPAGMHAMAARVRELLAAPDADGIGLPDLDPIDTPAGKVASRSAPTSAMSVIRSSAAASSPTPNAAAFPSRARCATSTSARRTVPMAWTTSNAITAPPCMSPVRPRPGWPTSRCCARTATG